MGLFISRIKNWLGYENLKNTDLNTEFNNLIAKVGADTLSSANSTNGSAPTVPAMQTQESPGAVGTEVLASTAQDDTQQLRYQIAAITGNPYWYSSPAASIASITSSLNSLFTVPASRIISGRMDANGQPMFLVPAGSSDTVTLKATATNFVAYTSGVSRTYVADISISGLSTAPSSNNTCLVNNTALTGTQATKSQGEFDTQITIDTVGSAITALNGKYAAFKTSTEYFIGLVDTTNNRIYKCTRGFGFDSSDAWIARVAVSDDQTITLMSLAWIFATYNASTPGLDVTYSKPTISVATPGAPSIGDYWYDVVNTTWKRYSGSAFVSQQATLIGACIVDTSNVVAARSFDFFKPFNTLNNIELEYLSTTSVRATKLNQQASVYGVTYPFTETQPVWDTSTTLDTGTTLIANTNYYCYVTNTGDLKTSFIAPHERKYDLLGQYLPNKPWRCIGSFLTDGTDSVSKTSVSVSLYNMQTLPKGLVNYYFTAPTLRAFGSGAAYVTPTAPYPLYLKVKLVGGGGGGSGSGQTLSGGAGGNGTNTTFSIPASTTLLTAGLGSGAIGNALPNGGAPGVSSADVSLTAVVLFNGTAGNSGAYGGTTASMSGGAGGASIFGGGGSGGGQTGSAYAGGIGAVTTGSGGGGAGTGLIGTSYSGGGGGSGGYAEAIIYNPLSTYTYAVGLGGAGGTAGTNGNAGGTGAGGIVIVEEYYQ